MTGTGPAGPAPAAPSIDLIQPRDFARTRSTATEAPARNDGTSTRVSISKEATQYAELKTYVRHLLEEQGVELNGEYWDDLSAEEAQAAIADGGAWSAESVADRILDFVGEISGGDPELKERLQDAVRQGFEEARQALGGWLPEVSERTYDLVFARFDEAFNQEGEEVAG